MKIYFSLIGENGSSNTSNTSEISNIHNGIKIREITNNSGGRMIINISEITNTHNIIKTSNMSDRSGSIKISNRILAGTKNIFWFNWWETNIYIIFLIILLPGQDLSDFTIIFKNFSQIYIYIKWLLCVHSTTICGSCVRPLGKPEEEFICHTN